jgi:DAK2 domain fusion protein YloV
MLLTLQSAVEDIKESPAMEVNKIARVAAHGSLMGARGNSGVILSQIFRGFGNAVQGKAELTPTDLADAFEEAANAAYRAVIKPTEGTILTVAREAGRAAVTAAAEPGASTASVIKAAAAGARAAVDRTPSQLKILHEAGVVDAGGYGLQIMLEGMLRTVEDTELDVLGGLSDLLPAAQAVLELPEEGWGYCTEFLIQGEDLDVGRIREEIAAMGNSVLVVGEPDLVKVHVHTDDPSKVINLASSYGRLDRLSVGDMSTQHRRIREESGADSETAAPARRNGIGLVAVVAGPGLADILRGLGADAIVEGGQTMNPSTLDMLAAAERVPYQDVILLPNNRNVVLAATQVNDLTSKNVQVLETVSVPQGVAALISFQPDRDLEENLAAMREAAARVQTIEVTHAVRDSRSNGLRVKKGDVIALINDRLEHAGKDYGTVVKQALDGIGVDGYELVTIYRGQQATDSDAEDLTKSIRGSFPALEVELQAGGQEHYPFILSIE